MSRKDRKLVKKAVEKILGNLILKIDYKIDEFDPYPDMDDGYESEGEIQATYKTTIDRYNDM